MIESSLLKKIFPILLIGILSILSYWRDVDKKSLLSPIYTESNQILAFNTGEPIILKGVVSDYFRSDFNGDYPKSFGGLEKELERLSQQMR